MNVTLLGFDDYQEKALRTLAPDSTQMVIAHCVVGIAGEVAELLRAELMCNLSNEIEEIGDILWYCAVLAKHLPTTSQIKFSETLEKCHGIPGYPLASALNTDVLILTSGEMLDTLKRCMFYKKVLDEKALYDGMSRVLHCIYKRVKHRHQTELLKVAEKNITKLALRFGDKYSEFKVVNRDIAAEEAVFTAGGAA